MARNVKCAYCGHLFLTDKPRVKYCDECRPKAQAQVRKRWEKKTNYTEKNRVRRNEKSKAERNETEQELLRKHKEKVAAFKRELLETTEKNNARLQDMAAAGDPHSNMLLALKSGGKYNKEYWYWYKELEMAACYEQDKQSTLHVNMININEPNFEDLVLESIEEFKSITITRSV